MRIFITQVNQDPTPFGDQTPDTSAFPTPEQILLEQSVELSWNLDDLPGDVFNRTKDKVAITPLLHDLLPQVKLDTPIRP